LGIEGQSLNGDPLWTKTGSWTMGLDPLGLQATSIRIYQSLVPNITNITNRLRYYAYFPWLVSLYEKLHHSDDPAKFANFMRRGEALYALATLVDDQQGSDGLGGSNWASQHRSEAAVNGIDFRPYTDDRTSPQTYLQASRGNYGVAYAPTLVEMEWLTRSSVPVTNGRGETVASAFAHSIGQVADNIEAVLLAGTATAKQLQDIGAAIHPAKIPSGSQEQSVLREFLIGTHDTTKDALSRRSTIWLVLDLIRKGVAPGDIDALRKAFYARRLPNDDVYNQSAETLDRWRAYQANEFGQVALAGALNALTGLQREDHPSGIEPKDLIEKVIANSLPASDQSWSQWASSLAPDPEADELRLIEPILQDLGNGVRPAQETMLCAFKLLAVLWARWAKGDEAVRPIIARMAGPDGRSLDGILRTLDLCQSLTAGEALAAVMLKHVVIDHQIIAGRKLSTAGTFTYHFLVEDGLLSEGLLGEYGYTTPRLFNLTRVLRDAGYLSDDGVTSDGEAFLEQHQPL
jgi:hypothetical protein